MGLWLLLEATKADSEVGLSPLLFRGVMTSWIVIDDLVPTKSRMVLSCSGQIVKVFGDATMYVSCGGPLTRSGSLLSIEGMNLDAVVNSTVATQHYAGIR